MLTATAPLQTRRPRLRPIVIGVVLTAAVVASGTALATAVLGHEQTPAEVAQAYLEARYAGDWHTAWAMECTMTHSFVGSQDRFARTGASWDDELGIPRDVVVEVADDAHPAAGLDSIIVVTAHVSSPERRDWSITGELPLRVKDDQIEVCDGGLGLNPPPGG